ncbi:DUF4148 domain-containing protein [Paraburkholderia sediminicola]|uniref:DUF4148 domain-containing protein n=1 Tax=Paraburkholderia sediminicola TaxID=458836 RepID=UPI0038BAE563
MKTLMSTIIIAAAIAMPAASFAQQTNGPLTRAQVRDGLVTAEQQGLVHQPKSQYPKALPASTGTTTGFDVSGYGPAVAGSSQTAAAPAAPISMDHSLFSHH